MYLTLLFDFDGTLFDTGPGIMKSAQYAALSLGYACPDWRALRSFVGPPLGRSFMQTFGADPAEADRLVAKYRERYAPVGVNECELYPGIEALLTDLRAAGRTLAVATGKPTVFAVQILERFGLSGRFDAVLGSEFDGTRAVKSEVIAALLERYGKAGAVMIGDRDNDVQGARSCGIPCVGVAWGYAEPGELEKTGAAAVAKDPEALKTILLR